MFLLSIISNDLISRDAEQTQKYKLDITEIDSIEFNNLKRKYYRVIPKPIGIENMDEAQEMLRNIVSFDEGSVTAIFPQKSKPLSFIVGDLYFLAYFPDDNILYLEGGHSSDVSFDLTTGESTEDVGVPSYQIPSPNNKYRINGYWSGHECSSYFYSTKA